MRGSINERFSTVGILILVFDVALLVVVVLLRARKRLAVLARAIPQFVIVTALLVVFSQLALPGEHWSECLVFALGALVFLGAAQVLRHRWLVDLSLASTVVTVGSLAWWVAPHGNGGLLAGWEGIVAGSLALAFWALAMLDRRFGKAEFHEGPCLQWGLLLTVVAFGLAVEARLLSRDAFGPGVAALLLDCVAILLIGRAWRSASLTYYAIAAFVAATYVWLLSVGEPDPRNAHVLGLVAVILALVFWFKGLVCRRLGGGLRQLYEGPFLISSQVLTLAAVPLAYWSPLTMALVALSFLLMVGSFPAIAWIYPAVLAAGVSSYYGYFMDRSWPSWLLGLTGGVYLFWLLALGARRWKRPLCRLCGLDELPYEDALAYSAIALGVVALAVRIAWSMQTGLPPTAHPEFALALAVFCFLMRAHGTSDLLVHSGFGLLTWTCASLTEFSWQSPMPLATTLSGLAMLFAAITPAVMPYWLPIFWPMLARIRTEGRIARGWSIALWLATLAITSTVMVLLVAIAVVPEVWDGGPMPTAHVSAFGVALMLAGWTFRLLVVDRPDGVLRLGSISFTYERFLLVALLEFAWWIGVERSPEDGTLRWPGLLPFVTALHSLLILSLVRYRDWRIANRRLHEEDETARPEADPFIEWGIFIVAILGVLFTRGAVGASTIATLVVSALSLGGLGLWSWTLDLGRLSTYAAAISWMAAFGVAGLEIAQRLHLDSDENRAIGAAIGLVAAGYSLLGMTSTWVRTGGRTIALERVAFVGSLVAAGCIAFAAMNPQAIGPKGTLVGVGCLAAIAWHSIMLAGRWGAELLVYLAQGALLGAYVVYRQTFHAPIATDAILLTLLAYLDFGIAEATDRLNLPIYSRPTRFVSYLLPLAPLVPMLGQGRLDEIGMFHLLAAGTFYGISFSATRWRPLGYAAAILYNAALWVWWSHLGWRMNEHPQFYFVPVGLSAILFAEANREELGHSMVKSFRSVGLILIYLTTAFPILKDQSFGAWLTLLALSLIGVFAGIALRAKVFVWMGLATFLLDIVYQLARFSADYAVAKWAIMLGLGVGLVLFVALNEKKRILGTMKLYYDHIQDWE